MNKPNLFNFATSELSQDAFIAWLLTWANKEYAEIDKNLHACAVDFVKKLLNKDDYVVEIVNVTTQWKHTDISAEVNGEYFLLIEDKTATKEHSNQLNRYLEKAKKRYANNHNIKIVPVYFKMEEQGNYEEIKKAKYALFTREDMLPILTRYHESVISTNTGNDILLDYFFHLTTLDEKINSYQTLSLDKWHRESWKGFFSAIQKDINVDNWGKVDNPAGGFMGLWWHGQSRNLDDKNFDIYLQLEEKKLIFKVAVKEHRKNCAKLREHCRKPLFEIAKQQNISIEKYGKAGKWMGISKLKDDYRIPKEDGLIDLPATIENLKKMERLINAVAEKL